MDCVIYEAAMEMEMRNWNRMKTRDYGYLIYRCNLKLAFNLILMHFSLNTLLVTSIARRWLAAEISHNFAHFLRPKRAISEIALTWLFYSSLFFFASLHHLLLASENHWNYCMLLTLTFSLTNPYMWICRLSIHSIGHGRI